MLWCFPEPITPDSTKPLYDLDARYFFDLGELVRFASLVCARWAYACGTNGDEETCSVPGRACPRARISHGYSHSLTTFSVLVEGFPGLPHEFRIPGLDMMLSGCFEACQWYEQLCEGIDRLIVNGLVGPPSKHTKQRIKVVNRIKVCESCASQGRFHPKPATHFEDRWLCRGCIEAIEKGRLQEQRRQERLSALTAKYGDEAVRRLAMEEERKKVTASLRLKILERDRFTCQLCGRTPPEVKLTVDHKLPVVDGGETEENNLWALCRDCNAGKGARIIELPEWA